MPHRSDTRRVREERARPPKRPSPRAPRRRNRGRPRLALPASIQSEALPFAVARTSISNETSA